MGMNRKITLFIVPLLLVLSVCLKLVSSSGASSPLIMNQNLPKGEIGRFAFIVSNGGNAVESSCSYSAQGLDPLTVTFDENQVVVPAQGEKSVEGSINIPVNAQEKTYHGNLIVSCSPHTTTMGATGSGVSRTYIVSFDVPVISERPVTTTVPTPAKPEEGPSITTSAILVIIIVVVVAIAVSFLFRKKKEVPKETSQT
jgi:preprotein translocase subunit SecG